MILNATRGAIRWLIPSRCGVCASVQDGDLLCSSCRNTLTTLRAPTGALFHDHGIASRLVRSAKYGQQRIAVNIITDAWIADMHTRNWSHIDIVTCVPPAPARARWRGIHLPHQLATMTARELGIPFRELLYRRGYRRQRTRSRDERFQNAAAQYEIHPAARHISGLRVLLIDDVRTTGATIAACTAALQRAGHVVDARTVTTRAMFRHHRENLQIL